MAENSVAENSDKTAIREVWGRPFQPGQSGNPGGRPKDISIVRDLARTHTSDAIQTLVSIMRDGRKEAARVAAAQAILDRGWGKAVQDLDIAGPAGAPLEIVVRHVRYPTTP